MKIETPQDLRDRRLENQITDAYYRWLADGTEENLKALNALILQRSPAQVERMERAKGLSK